MPALIAVVMWACGVGALGVCGWGISRLAASEHERLVATCFDLIDLAESEGRISADWARLLRRKAQVDPDWRGIRRDIVQFGYRNRFGR